MSSICETASTDGVACFEGDCPTKTRKCARCPEHKKTFLCKKHRYFGCCRCHLPGTYERDSSPGSSSIFEEAMQVFLVEKSTRKKIWKHDTRHITFRVPVHINCSTFCKKHLQLPHVRFPGYVPPQPSW